MRLFSLHAQAIRCVHRSPKGVRQGRSLALLDAVEHDFITLNDLAESEVSDGSVTHKLSRKPGL